MFKKCKKDKNVITNYNAKSQMLFIQLSLGLLAFTLIGCEQLPSSLSSSQSSIQAQVENQAQSTKLRDTSKSAGILLADKVVDAKLPTPTKILECSQIQPNQTITVDGHIKLAASCHLFEKSVRFMLHTSNTSLDCNGNTLSPNPKDTSNASAITIQPKTDAPIADIGIANCHIEGYGHALHIRQRTNPNVRYTQGFSDPDANRAQAPERIKVVNLSSSDSRNSAIFVGDHVHHVSFDKLYVMRAGTVGLYLEFGSQYNQVKNSVFVDNGYRRFKPNREAIAIDSSSHNLIEGNQFIHNGAGAIQLYRNCFEHASDSTRSNHFKRTESAANNIIKNNVFREEPVGVWVASRQSRNLKGFECGAYLLAKTPFSDYYIDSARDNQILNNTFIEVDAGIIVEDDGSQIIGNDFSQSRGQPIKIGSKIREKYAHNVEGLSPTIEDTVARDNKMPD